MAGVGYPHPRPPPPPLTAARPAAPRPRSLTTRRAVGPQELALLAAAGDVDAPIGVVIGGAIVVTLVATAIVPLALKPGDDAAQKASGRGGVHPSVHASACELPAAAPSRNGAMQTALHARRRRAAALRGCP